MDRAHRRLLALLGVALVCEGYGRSVLSITLHDVGVDLHADSASLSYALALVTAGSLGVLLLGPMSDRFGRRRLLLVSLAGYAIFAAGTASAGGIASLVAWQVIARAFQESLLAGATVMAAEAMPATRRGEAQGVLGFANNVGPGFAAFLFAFVRVLPGGWRTLLGLQAIPLLLLPMLARRIPESERWRTGRGSRRRLPEGHGSRAALLLVVCFLATAYDVAGFGFTAYFPMTVHGWSPARASAMIIVAGGAGMPGWWIGGRLADGVGRRATCIVFLVGLTLAELAFYLGGEPWLWPAFALMGFSQGGKTTALRAWATELFPTSIRGTVAGWASAAATLGGMAGFGAVGALSTLTGGLAPALAALALTGLLAAAASTLLPETRGLELEAIAPDLVG